MYRLLVGLTCLSITVLSTVAVLRENADASAQRSIATELHPGWNLVGWLESPVPLDSLFARVPSLQVACWLDRSVGSTPTMQWQCGSDDAEVRVRTGDSLWLRITGDHTVTLTQQEHHVPASSLDVGWNAVVWAWDDSHWPELSLLPGASEDNERRLHPWDAAAAIVGERLVGILQWDPRNQAWKSYIRKVATDGHHDSAQALNPGESLLILLTGSADWTGPSGPLITGTYRITAADERTLRKTVDDFASYQAARWPRQMPSLLLTIEVWPESTPCLYGGGRSIVRLYLPCDRIQRLTQEAMARAFVNALDHLVAPEWIVEGYANSLVLNYYADQNIQARSDAKQTLIAVSRSTSQDLLDVIRRSRDFEATSLQRSSHAYLRRMISTLAVDWLIEAHGEAPMRDFVRDLGKGYWHHAFESAFGLPFDEMLSRFSSYRESLAPIGGRTLWMDRPHHQAVFAGQSTEDRVMLIDSLNDIIESFADRYGVVASATTFVLDVPDEQYSRAEGSLDPRSCARAPQGVVLARVPCSRPHVLAHEYFHMLQQEVSDSAYYARAPWWLQEGTATYAALEYTTAGVWEGLSERDEVMSLQREAAASVIQRPNAQQTVSEQAAAALERSPYMVGESAVRFLVGRVGEDALLDAFGPEWAMGGHDEASRFENIFDWPLDDFLTEFGTWLLQQKRSP